MYGKDLPHDITMLFGKTYVFMRKKFAEHRRILATIRTTTYKCLGESPSLGLRLRCGIIGAQFRNDFRRCHARQIVLFAGKRNCSYPSMAATAIALADRSQIDHLFRLDLGPRIGAHRDLCPKTGSAETDTVGRFRMQIVRDELVVSLKRMVGDVKIDCSPLAQ